MKEVMAIIRMNRINETKRAISDAGVGSFTARKCLGRGKGKVDFRVLNGAKEGSEEAIAQLGEGQRLIPKRALTMIIPDDKVQAVVDVIIKTNQTGKPGDGKIFVMPVLEAVRIRTGERADAAIDYAGEE